MHLTLNIPTLTTERLSLRAPQLGDFPVYADIFASDRAKYMDGPLERNAAWQSFAADAIGWLIQGFGYWTVTDRADDKIVGMVGHMKPPAYPERELGWMVSSEYEGKGFAFEAANAARNWAYQQPGWRNLVSYIDRKNQRSIALATRLGCTLDAMADKPDKHTMVYRHPAPGALQ